MPVDFDRHNGAFLHHFGEKEPAIYSNFAGGNTYHVVFVRGSLLVAFPDGVNNAIEAIWIQRSNLQANPATGDSVVIADTTYRVVSVRDDRAGGVYLALN